MYINGKIQKPVVIMIANQKGGVGKTTLTLELSNVLGKKGYKVLGIDLDPQISFSKLSGAVVEDDLSIKKTLDSKFGTITPINGLIQSLDNYDIVVGSEALSESSSLYGAEGDDWLLADALETVTDYDIILIDSAPGRSRLLYMSYLSADWVLIPTEADTEANAGIYKIAADLKQYSKRNMCHAKILGFVMTKFENTRLHRFMYDNLILIGKEVNSYPFYTKISKTVKANEARLSKQSIADYDTKSKVVENYSDLADEIVNRIGV